ncbi:hypothetical protein CspHIS471_0406750 [Cutaneotrichosporon sp. HIS471]|nr:hypothetical protein CspHIS471_0406750 [Cutaneotrichosporon sp. HIS471]
MLMLRRAPVASALLKASPCVRAMGIARYTSTRALSTSGWNLARQSNVVPDLELDPSFDALLGDMQMRSKSRSNAPRQVEEHELELVSSGFGVRRQAPADEEEVEWADRRSSRRSPATILGSKKIGMVVLPDALVEGVQDAIEATEDKKHVRYAYLELLEPVKEKSPGGSRNMPQHAIARASAFLPAQYGATYNVLAELDKRVGGITGPLIEVSGGLGPGLWASSEVFGEAALQDFTLVHRTRFGLDLAQELAQNLPGDISFKRDITSVSGPPPQVVMATFALSVLPTGRGRRDLLQHMLNMGAEHMVLVDLAGDAGWTAMKQARQWLLAQSTEDNPLHITAPCPHDGKCPRVDMIEPCAFSQRIQRPRFTRKTKHAKRGEEDVSYSYLIVSRGQRPEAPSGLEEGVGRFGAVGREAAARALAKVTGRTEIREVEGSEVGELEVVEIAHDITLPAMEDPVETEQLLKAEAYAWPRLVAPPLKRSGFVVMDACMPNEKLMRFTVAKSLGKQSYYDARKSGWGDLWPHAFKGAVERKRGVRLLTEPNAEDMALPSAEDEQAWLDGQADQDMFAVDPDMDRLIKDLAKDALVEVEDIGAPATVYSASSDYVPEPEVTKKRKEPKTKAAKKRAAQREKRETARERKTKLRDARADKAELTRADRFFYRDADTATVREFEADDPETEPLRPMSEMEPGLRDMGAALKDNRRRGPGFPFNTYGRELHTSARGLHTSARALSVAPGATGSSQKSARPKVTVASLQAQHNASDPITMLTAYDFPTSVLSSRAGVDIVLVGDSMAQVCLGYESTIPLTLEDVVHHTRAVARGAGSSFLLADMPFGYVASSIEAGMDAAIRMVKEGGADGIKIEGGREIIPLVERLSAFGISVMPHIGLQPQRAGVTGYRAQGRTASAAADMVALAGEMEAAGAFALLVEAVPHHVGTTLARSVNIPTIGIGAGPNTSGQVLVITDVLGSLDVGPEAGGEEEPPKMAKFVRQFGSVGRASRAAVDEYVREVKARSYPVVPAETYEHHQRPTRDRSRTHCGTSNINSELPSPINGHLTHIEPAQSSNLLNNRQPHPTFTMASAYDDLDFDPVPDLVGNPSSMLQFLDFGDEDSGAESSPKTVSDNHTPSPPSFAFTSPPSYNPSEFAFDFADEKKAMGGPAYMEDIQIKQEPGTEIAPAQAPVQPPPPQMLPPPQQDQSPLPAALLPAQQQEALQQLLASFMNYQSQWGLTDGTLNPSLLASTPGSMTPTSASFSPSSATTAPMTVAVPTPVVPTVNFVPPQQEADEPLVSITPGEIASPGPSRSDRAASSFSTGDDIDSRIEQLVPLNSIFSAGRGKGGKKGGGMSSVVRNDGEEIDDDESWRPSPEEYKKLSSKEKRQLRNKLSARAFRTRRKDYIGTLESHIKDRDTVIDAIRYELSTTRSENQDLRRELEALRASTLSVLHPQQATQPITPATSEDTPAPVAVPAPVVQPPAMVRRTTTTPTVNTRKDLAPFATGNAFWAGNENMFGGGNNTVCHTALTPEITLPPQPNLNPMLNGEVERGAKHTSLHTGDRDIESSSFADWSLETPFSFNSMESYRMQLWSRLSRAAASDKAGIPSAMRPKFFTETNTKAAESSALSALAVAATEHVAIKLASSFWSALSGSSNKLDVDKLAAVVTGKSRLAVVPNEKNKSFEDDLARAMAGLKVQTGTTSPAESLRTREHPLNAVAGLLFKPAMSALA